MAVNTYGPVPNHPPAMDIIAIKDICAGLKNINVIFIILEVGPVTLTKENREVRTFKVADQSAAINVSIWDEPGKQLLPGDIVRLTKGYAAIWRQCLTLYSGKNGEIVRLGDFCYTFNEMINMSDPNPILNLVPASQPVLNNGSVGGMNNIGGGSVPPATIGQNNATGNNGSGKPASRAQGAPPTAPTTGATPIGAYEAPPPPSGPVATPAVNAQTKPGNQTAARFSAGAEQSKSSPKNAPRTGRSGGQSKATATKNERR